MLAAIKSSARASEESQAAILKALEQQQGTLDGMGYDLALSRQALEESTFHLKALAERLAPAPWGD